MPTKKTAITVAAGVVVLGAGLGVAGLAAADPTATPSASPSSSPTAAPDSDRRGGWGGWGGRHHGGFGAGTAELAEKLGVSEDKLREAFRAAGEANRSADRPDTEAERDARQAEFVKKLAEELGVEEAQVTKAFEELRTERQEKRADALQDRLDEAVKDGTLTQAEADAVTKAVEKGVIGGGWPR